MKKVLLAALISLTLCSAVLAGEFAHQKTGGFNNGRFITDERGWEDGKPGTGILYFLFGAMEALNFARPDIMVSLYPNATKKDIIDAVVYYYQSNPTQRHRPVVEVILSGCK